MATPTASSEEISSAFQSLYAAQPTGRSEYLRHLVNQIGYLFSADLVWVAQVSPQNPSILRTVAASAKGNSVEDFEYSLLDSPAAGTLDSSAVCLFPAGVRTWFDTDEILRSCDASAYASIGLIGPGGHSLGLLAIAASNPFSNPRIIAPRLRVFASTVTAELEKMRLIQHLHNQEFRFRTIFENLPDACILLSLDGRLIEANRMAEVITGYRREELVNRNVLLPGLLPEPDLRRAIAGMAERAAGLPSTPEIFTILRKDDRQVNIETYSERITLDGESILLLRFREVTDTRGTDGGDRADRLVRECELKSLALDLAVDDALNSDDQSQLAAHVTEQLCRVTGIRAASIWALSSDRRDLVCLDRYEANRNFHAKGIPLASYSAARHLTALGSNRLVMNADLCPPVVPGGNPARWVDVGLGRGETVFGFIRVCSSPEVPFGQDPMEAEFLTLVARLVTRALENAETRQARELLLRRDEHAHRARKMAGLGFWTVDLQTESMYWSDEVFPIYGVSRETFIPHRRFFLDAVLEADRKQIDGALNELVLSGQPGEITFRIVRPDGTERYVHEHAELEFDDRGEPCRIIGSVEDITSFKEMEHRLSSAERRENLEWLSSGIGQSFNNVLTIVAGHATLIQRNPSNPSVLKNSLEGIRRATENAAALVQRLMAFGERATGPSVRMDLNQIIQDLEDLLRLSVGSGTELILSLDPNLNKIEAKAGEIQQILVSVVTKARDAMRQGGQLIIRTSNMSDLKLSGPERFVSGPWTLLSLNYTHDAPGDGDDEQPASGQFSAGPTGLEIVEKLVSQYGGHMRAGQTSASSTAVNIFLPAAVPDDDIATVVQTTDSRLCGRETLLVAEDQPEVRNLTCSVLEGFGYRVLSAANADAALNIVTTHSDPIDVLITDIVMPGMRGEQLARHIRDLRPDMKILFMSGYTPDSAIRRQSPESGTGFISKPFDPFVLAAKLRDLIGDAEAAGSVLISDGEESRRRLLRRVLTNAGYRVLECSSSAELAETYPACDFEVLLVECSQLSASLLAPLRNGIQRRAFSFKVIGIATDPLCPATPGVETILRNPIQPDVLLANVSHSLRASY